MGNYIALSEPYMEEQDMNLNFSYKNNSYLVSVTRVSLFENYSYNILKISLNNYAQLILNFQVKRYDEFVIVDNEISCAVTD